MRLKNFIGGQYCEPKNQKYLPNHDPSTGQVYSEIPDSEEADIQAAVTAAQAAFQTWSKTSADERSKILFKIADLIERDMDKLAAAESLDVGKPVWLAKSMDISRAAHNFRFFAQRILHHEEMSTDMDGKALNYSLRQAIGVTGLISPWNLPLYLLTWKIAPALACGNTAVCKPSEVTPMTAFLLTELMAEAGLPAGVCNMVFGDGPKAGASLVSHPNVPLISFTGGTQTGQKIIELSAPYFKKLSLELGGKNANIIFGDTDIDKAIEASVKSSFLNQGEICLCGSRVYIQENIYDEFVARFVDQVRELKVGDPKDPHTFMGPLVSKDHSQKVIQAIELAKKEGSSILYGGKKPEQLPSHMENGFFVEPTIVADLTDNSCLWKDEIFGPVVTLRPFKTAEEVISLANNSQYGLSASLWTKDLSTAHQVASQLEVGTVWVNTWLKRDLRVPFGGVKASGLGREGGDHSIDFYTEQKNVCIQF